MVRWWKTSRFNKGKHYTHHLLVKFCRNTDNCKLSLVKKKRKDSLFVQPYLLTFYWTLPSGHVTRYQSIANYEDDLLSVGTGHNPFSKNKGERAKRPENVGYLSIWGPSGIFSLWSAFSSPSVTQGNSNGGFFFATDPQLLPPDLACETFHALAKINCYVTKPTLLRFSFVS